MKQLVMPSKLKTVIVMPAYNAERTLEATVRDIPKDIVDKIILVDDCSKDNTVEIAKKLGLKIIVHEKNLGYGANQKTCYREALKSSADIVVMVHPDYQYDPRLTPYLTGIIKDGICGYSVGESNKNKKRNICRWNAIV